MVVPGYKEAQYAEERIWVHAPDGMRVPSTYLYRKERPLRAETPQPMLLYAYGAYGDAVGPTFSALSLLLVDRGIVYGGARLLTSLPLLLVLSFTPLATSSYSAFECII